MLEFQENATTQTTVLCVFLVLFKLPQLILSILQTFYFIILYKF